MVEPHDGNASGPPSRAAYAADLSTDCEFLLDYEIDEERTRSSPASSSSTPSAARSRTSREGSFEESGWTGDLR